MNKLIMLMVKENEKQIKEKNYRSNLMKKILDFLMSINFLIVIAVVLLIFTAYMIGYLVWWEWDA